MVAHYDGEDDVAVGYALLTMLSIPNLQLLEGQDMVAVYRVGLQVVHILGRVLAVHVLVVHHERKLYVCSGSVYA